MCCSTDSHHRDPQIHWTSTQRKSWSESHSSVLDLKCIIFQSIFTHYQSHISLRTCALTCRGASWVKSVCIVTTSGLSKPQLLELNGSLTEPQSTIQAGLQPIVSWHRHQTTKPRDLRAASEIWARWAFNSNQTGAIWATKETCVALCLHVCISAVCERAAHIGEHVCFICVCYLHVSGPEGRMQFLVNKQKHMDPDSKGQQRLCEMRWGVLADLQHRLYSIPTTSILYDAATHLSRVHTIKENPSIYFK